MFNEYSALSIVYSKNKTACACAHASYGILFESKKQDYTSPALFNRFLICGPAIIAITIFAVSPKINGSTPAASASGKVMPA